MFGCLICGVTLGLCSLDACTRFACAVCVYDSLEHCEVCDASSFKLAAIIHEHIFEILFAVLAVAQYLFAFGRIDAGNAESHNGFVVLAATLAA